MQIIRDITTLRQQVKKTRLSGKTVGLVPTMGYLHEGHLSLLHKAGQETNLKVLSIFVNPLQFGVGEDFEEYPRDLEGDAAQAEKAGCDIIFAPSIKEMYPKGYATFVDVERLTEELCGASRPGHFRGVTTVVSKLFNIVTPDRAYFGQKDAQQALVIQRMARDLNMDLEVVIMPTIREEDGLAMSSRNTYLSQEERTAATILSQSLFMAADKIKNGETSVRNILDLIIQTISSEPLAKIDYVKIVDTDEITPIETITGRTLIALAVRFGKTRLIDNIIVEV
jgi:pantoate--beta-alanine ligase